MRTQVIQLDPHDDVTSVRDRMAWAKAARILLVYPSHGRALARPLDLRLLQRHAEALGGQIAIAARQEEIRLAGREAGIPVFKSALVAQRRTWETKGSSHASLRRAPRPDLRRMRREVFPEEAGWRNRLGVRLAFFCLAVLAVLFLVLLFFPAARLELTPETQIQNLSIPTSAGLGVNSVNLSGSLPARLVYITYERSQTIPVTGSLVTPNIPAEGSVVFTNLTVGVVGVPAGTVVGTSDKSPIRFATTQDAVVPAGVGKTIDVPIRAIQAGSTGNLQADRLIAIEGDLGTDLAATNPDPTTGGSDRSAPVQTETDRARLRAALVAEILEQCRSSLPKQITLEDVFFPDTLSVGQVLSEVYFPAAGQTGATLTLTLNLQCQAEYALAADVTNLARMALDANLPAGFEPVYQAVEIVNSGPAVTDVDGLSHWQVQAQRLLHARLDPLQAIHLVQGRSIKSARQRLAVSMRLGKPPVISLSPTWWPWLPAVPFRIAVTMR